MREPRAQGLRTVRGDIDAALADECRPDLVAAVEAGDIAEHAARPALCERRRRGWRDRSGRTAASVMPGGEERVLVGGAALPDDDARAAGDPGQFGESVRWVEREQRHRDVE